MLKMSLKLDKCRKCGSKLDMIGKCEHCGKKRSQKSDDFKKRYGQMSDLKEFDVCKDCHVRNECDNDETTRCFVRPLRQGKNLKIRIQMEA